MKFILRYFVGMKAIRDLDNEIKASGLKKSFIAEKIGLKQSTLSMMLKGHNNMPDETMKRIKNIVRQAMTIKA